MHGKMQAHYRCYFIDRDGNGRSVTTIPAPDPASAVDIALRRFPRLKHQSVEVFEGSDRVYSRAGAPARRAPPIAINDGGAALAVSHA
jgi:hypothetical protein